MGRKPLPQEKVEEIKRLYNEGYTYKYISYIAKVGLNTIIRHTDKNRKTDHGWTKEEHEKLMRLKKEGMNCEDIACILGRTKLSVQSRYTQLKTGRIKI